MNLSEVRISAPKLPPNVAKNADVYDFMLPRITFNQEGRKILFVTDRIARELEDGWQGYRPAAIFHAEHEIVLNKMFNHIIKQTDEPLKECLFLNYPSFFIQDKTLYNQSKYLFVDRLVDSIERYKPDCVVFCGIPAYVEFIMATTNDKNRKHIKGYVGRVWDWKHKDRDVSCQMVGSLSIHQLASQQSDEMAVYPNLIGFFCRSVVTAIEGRNRYTIDVSGSKFVYIDSIEKFDRFYKKLLDAPIVALDTEGKSLARTTNELYSIQFAFTGTKAYFLPMFHPKTPFSRKELTYICNKLRYYFEFCRCKYHVYQNAKFDITMLKIPNKSLGVRHYNHRIFDTIAGMFCFLPDTYVKTEIGPIKIKDLVAMPNLPKVVSYNHSTATVEYKEIINTFELNNNKRMVEIEYEGGSITVTEDHTVWSKTRNNYIKAKDILPDEEILIIDDA